MERKTTQDIICVSLSPSPKPSPSPSLDKLPQVPLTSLNFGKGKFESCHYFEPDIMQLVHMSKLQRTDWESSHMTVSPPSHHS